MVSVLVERHSFFPGPDGPHLRWTETSPPEAHRHHLDCGCTSDVGARPPGSPESVRQSFTLSLGGASLPVGTGQLTFGKLGGKEHRYFWFSPRERSVRIEIALPGHGLVDCFFAHLYFGSGVDTSRLMNGFLPSRLDLSGVGDLHWLHACSWGTEGLRILSSPEEAWLWDRAYALNEFVNLAAAPYVADLSSPVDDLRSRVEADEGLLRDFVKLRDLLAPLAADVRPTELYRLASELEAEVYGRALLR